jgi:hypothetical protein
MLSCILVSHVLMTCYKAWYIKHWYLTTLHAQLIVHHGGSRGKWYNRLKISQATLMPCSTASNACSLVNGSSSRIGHNIKGRSMGRSASRSPCTDVSPNGGRARSRLVDCEGVTSIMVTEAGVGCARASDSHSHSGPVLAEEDGPVGRLLTTVAVTVVTDGTAVAQFGGAPPGAPHR